MATMSVKVDVGTPTGNIKPWTTAEVHFHGFADLTTTRNESAVSPEFICLGHEWRLAVYPGGLGASREGMMDAYLYNLTNKPIKVEFGFSVKDSAGKHVHDYSVPEAHEFNNKSVTNTTNQWGFRDYAKRSNIMKKLVDGALIIEVRMRNMNTEREDPPLFIPENPSNCKLLQSMFNDEESADVLFEVGGQSTKSSTRKKKAKTTTTFYAHRAIVRKSSSILGELCKSEASVSITDVSTDIFRHVLHYLYGGKVSDEDMKEHAKDIIDAADKYGVVGLKLEAEASLVTATTITFDSAIDNLLYADGKNCALLKETVLDFIADNGKEAAKKLSFEHVPSTVIPYLLTAMSKGNETETGGDTASIENDLSAMRVNALRKMLHEKGLDVDGSREMMIARLEEG